MSDSWTLLSFSVRACALAMGWLSALIGDGGWKCQLLLAPCRLSDRAMFGVDHRRAAACSGRGCDPSYLYRPWLRYVSSWPMGERALSPVLQIDSVKQTDLRLFQRDSPSSNCQISCRSCDCSAPVALRLDSDAACWYCFRADIYPVADRSVNRRRCCARGIYSRIAFCSDASVRCADARVSRIMPSYSCQSRFQNICE